MDMDIGLTRDRTHPAAAGYPARQRHARWRAHPPHGDPRRESHAIPGSARHRRPATVVIIPEYKQPLPATVEQGIRLFTVHVRRGAPDMLDPKLNSHSKLNDIMACIQASQGRLR